MADASVVDTFLTKSILIYKLIINVFNDNIKILTIIHGTKVCLLNIVLKILIDHTLRGSPYAIASYSG